MDRRRAMLVIAGATLHALSPRSAEAQVNEPAFFASSLTEKMLGEQKLKAVNELVDGFWNKPQARAHITKLLLGGAKDRSAARAKLEQGSRMYIPSSEKAKLVREKYHAQANELAGAIPENKYGLLLDGDEQSLYILQNIGQNRMQFIKAYPVSTSAAGWSNVPDSRYTPVGLHRIGHRSEGLFGEVVSHDANSLKQFARIPVRENKRTKVRTFVKSLNSGGDARAEIVTASLLIVGPSTPSTRGIYIHGTNREDLLGTPASGGCVRLSNVDVRDLMHYMEVGKLQSDERTTFGGTPVMICTSQTILESLPDNSRTYPPAWEPPDEKGEQQNRAPADSERTAPTAAPRPEKSRRRNPAPWIPPSQE